MQYVAVTAVTEVYQLGKKRLTVTNNVTGQQINGVVRLADGSYVEWSTTSGATAVLTAANIKGALDAKTAVVAEYTTSTDGVSTVDIEQKLAIGDENNFEFSIVGALTGGLAITPSNVTSVHRTVRRFTLKLATAAAVAAGDMYLSKLTQRNRKPSIYRVVSGDTATATVVVDDVLDTLAPSTGLKISAVNNPDGVLMKPSEIDSVPHWHPEWTAEYQWIDRLLNHIKTGRTREVADASFTVNWLDRQITLTSTTSAGNYSAIFDANTGWDGQRVVLVLPAALGGTDAFVTSGMKTAANAALNKTLDAAGDRLEAFYCAKNNTWYMLNDLVA